MSGTDCAGSLAGRVFPQLRLVRRRATDLDDLKHEQAAGHAVPTLSELVPLHERVLELFGFQPLAAPAQSKPPDSARTVRRQRHQCSHQRPVRIAAIPQNGAYSRDLAKSLKRLTNRELASTHGAVQP